jgi:hypothetical protein
MHDKKEKKAKKSEDAHTDRTQMNIFRCCMGYNISRDAEDG